MFGLEIGLIVRMLLSAISFILIAMYIASR